MEKQKRNLISKRIGICEHMPANKFSRLVFKDADEFDSTINNNGDIGRCLKNQYRSDDWLCAWIKCDVNKLMGKTNAFYVYNVDYEDVVKPLKKYLNEDRLYEIANGVMYFDFDNINDENVIETVKNCFIEVGKKYHNFQWFETSWSGKGCHIRLNFDLKIHHKVEWMYLYFYHLDILLKEIKKHICIDDWIEKVIDFSCASITRGFAIPYNENGVVKNEYFNSEITQYESVEEIQLEANMCCPIWEDGLLDKFLKLIDKQKHNERPFKSKYNVKSIIPENAKQQSGEMFDYNWRLKCVTTLMAIYNGDKDLVREACKYIYSFITPYKTHTFDEMLYDELENKIFRNGDMTLNASNEIIFDLEKYFGFEFELSFVTNQVYLSEFHKKILD